MKDTTYLDEFRDYLYYIISTQYREDIIGYIELITAIYLYNLSISPNIGNKIKTIKLNKRIEFDFDIADEVIKIITDYKKYKALLSLYNYSNKEQGSYGLYIVYNNNDYVSLKPLVQDIINNFKNDDLTIGYYKKAKFEYILDLARLLSALAKFIIQVRYNVRNDSFDYIFSEKMKNVDIIKNIRDKMNTLLNILPEMELKTFIDILELSEKKYSKQLPTKKMKPETYLFQFYPIEYPEYANYELLLNMTFNIHKSYEIIIKDDQMDKTPQELFNFLSEQYYSIVSKLKSPYNVLFSGKDRSLEKILSLDKISLYELATLLLSFKDIIRQRIYHILSGKYYTSVFNKKTGSKYLKLETQEILKEMNEKNLQKLFDINEKFNEEIIDKVSEFSYIYSKKIDFYTLFEDICNTEVTTVPITSKNTDIPAFKDIGLAGAYNIGRIDVVKFRQIINRIKELTKKEMSNTITPEEKQELQRLEKEKQLEIQKGIIVSCKKIITNEAYDIYSQAYKIYKKIEINGRIVLEYAYKTLGIPKEQQFITINNITYDSLMNFINENKNKFSMNIEVSDIDSENARIYREIMSYALLSLCKTFLFDYIENLKNQILIPPDFKLDILFSMSGLAPSYILTKILSVDKTHIKRIKGLMSVSGGKSGEDEQMDDNVSFIKFYSTDDERNRTKEIIKNLGKKRKGEVWIIIFKIIKCYLGCILKVIFLEYGFFCLIKMSNMLKILLKRIEYMR